MRVVVADASSLILLTKCSLLRKYANRVELITSRVVVDEVASSSLQRLHPDAVEIARAIADGVLGAKPVRSRKKLPLTLGRGEAAAIRLFVEEDAALVLTDDGRGLRTCRLLSIPFTTTPRVTVDLHRVGDVSTVEARRALEKLAVIGRYSSEIIAAALTALKED